MRHIRLAVPLVAGMGLAALCAAHGATGPLRRLCLPP
jgi:hypothetical protein